MKPTITDLLEMWNRPQMLRDWSDEDDFVAAFIASPDVDELDESLTEVEAAARAYWRLAVEEARNSKRKTNPMTRAKRTPTPAQMAARERFAEMARSGAFKKAGAAKRKKNPDNMGSYGPFYGDTEAPMTEAQIERRAESYMDRLDRLLMRNEITQTVYNREVKALDKWTKDQYAKRRKTNPAKKTVSQKISQLTREGYPQKQAVAIALNEERAGKVRRNPAAKKNGPFYFALVPDDGGFAYGMDERTPVQFIFTNRDRTRGIYRSFALPFSVTGNPAFQAWAASLPGNAVFASLKELRETLRAYT